MNLNNLILELDKIVELNNIHKSEVGILVDYIKEEHITLLFKEIMKITKGKMDPKDLHNLVYLYCKYNIPFKGNNND